MENLDAVDFSGQFFKREHFETFNRDKIHRNSPEILEERKDVQNRLLDLHDIIYPEIVNWEIKSHEHPEHIVSGIDIDNPFIQNTLRSIWLHYGKSPDEIKGYQRLVSDPSSQTFIHHPRLQVIIYNHPNESLDDYGVGVWFVIGKNGGSTFDRNWIQDRVQEDEFFTDRFFRLVMELGDNYFIDVRDNPRRNIGTISNINEFVDIVSRDHIDEYFIIGRNHEPNSEELSETNISNTLLSEFEKLYQLYIHVKHRVN